MPRAFSCPICHGGFEASPGDGGAVTCVTCGHKFVAKVDPVATAIAKKRSKKGGGRTAFLLLVLVGAAAGGAFYVGPARILAMFNTADPPRQSSTTIIMQGEEAVTTHPSGGPDLTATYQSLVNRYGAARVFRVHVLHADTPEARKAVRDRFNTLTKRHSDLFWISAASRDGVSLIVGPVDDPAPLVNALEFSAGDASIDPASRTITATYR